MGRAEGDPTMSRLDVEKVVMTDMVMLTVMMVMVMVIRATQRCPGWMWRGWLSVTDIASGGGQMNMMVSELYCSK